jgi:hypothetical protein
MEMTTRDPWDALDADLAGLHAHDANAERVERIRARCVAALAAMQDRRYARRARNAAWQRRLEQAAAYGLSVIYLAAAVGSALALLR